MSIERMQKGLRISFQLTIPLPKRWHRSVKHTPEARKNMSKAQRDRRAKAKVKVDTSEYDTPDGFAALDEYDNA